MTTANLHSLSHDNIVAFLQDIFERRGDEEYLGEPVTMAQHMLQGAHLAELAGEPEDTIVAALLHDIGHFTSEFGMFSMNDTEDRFHEEAGAKVLQPFFPDLVTDCVQHHVSAKRYLCATNPEYYQQLSEASVHSLNLQGGPMSASEVQIFEQQKNLKDIVKVRLFDDAGKVANLQTKSFVEYVPLVQRVVNSARQADC